MAQMETQTAIRKLVQKSGKHLSLLFVCLFADVFVGGPVVEALGGDDGEFWGTCMVQFIVFLMIHQRCQTPLTLFPSEGY